MKIFCIFDSKADAFLAPIFAVTEGIARRMFYDVVNDPSSAFNKHPGDYTLFEIGDFDERKGFISGLESYTNLGNALTYLSGDLDEMESS